MDAQDYRKTHSSGNESHGVHVCNKCGWQYPNPHPSAKHRRAHKKICGTIEGHKLVDSEKTTQIPCLDDKHLSDDDHKTPSEKTIGGTGAISSRSEEEVFADAVCEFSCSGVSPSSDPSEENKESATTNDVEKIMKTNGNYSGEGQECSGSTTACEVRNPEVSDSCKGSPAEVLETRDLASSSIGTAASNQQDDKCSADGGSQSVASKAPIDSSQATLVIDASETVNIVGLETEQKGNGCVMAERNLTEDFTSELARAAGKREDVADTIWNDDVVYSEVAGPDGVASEKLGVVQSTEDEHNRMDNVLVDTSLVKTNATQDIRTTDSIVLTKHCHGITADKDDDVSFSVSDDVLSAENSEVSLQDFKDDKELKLHQSASPGLSKTNPEEECETGTAVHADISEVVQSGQLSIGTEDPSVDMLFLGDKNEHQGQNALTVVEEFPVGEKVELSQIGKTFVKELEESIDPDIKVEVSQIGKTFVKELEESIDPEHIEIKAEKLEASESSMVTSQDMIMSETWRTAMSGLDPVIGDTNADVNRTDNLVRRVAPVGHENDFVQENVVADEDNKETMNEGNCTESKISSESSGITECHVSLVPDVFQGGDVSDHAKGPTEACQDNSAQNDGEICGHNDEARTESNGRLGERNILTETTNTQVDAVSQSRSVVTASEGSVITASGAVKTYDQKLPESGRTDSHGVLGGHRVAVGNEINNNGSTQWDCAEVPLAVEIYHNRDFGQLLNPSEAQVRSLLSSSMASRDTTHASEDACGSKSQPLQTGDDASFSKQQHNKSARDVSFHSSNRRDSLEANYGSVSDRPVSVDAELQKTNTKPSDDAPSRNNAGKSYKFEPLLCVTPDWPAELDGDKYYETKGATGKTASSEAHKPENPSQLSSAALTKNKNEEIIEKKTIQSATKQQHVPLKNLLSEARSPKQKAKDNNSGSSSVMPRVRSILGPETSVDSPSTGKEEASEEWNTPARYPVDMKREERKAKNRPFWVPFVCCSSAH